jgi:cobalt-zinc-cadmium efflux system outer membrane protein
MKRFRQSLWLFLPLCLHGCCFANRQIDKEIANLSLCMESASPHPVVDMPPAQAEAPTQSRASSSTMPPLKDVMPTTQPPPGTPASIPKLDASETEPPSRKRLTVPPDLPGADEPPLDLPKDKAERDAYLRKLFPPLEPVAPLPPLAPGPEGHPLTLADLQRLAATYSPAIKSAIAAVEAAKGAVFQAGAYPNPTMFFEQDTVGTGPGGYEGFGMHQTIKTAGKLKLQQASAMIDLMNAELALRRAYTDLAYQVRGFYFGVLVAREGARINEALFHFTAKVYQLQVATVLTGGFSAAYEPVQLSTLVDQARISLIQSQNQYRAAWRQLVAAVGLRDMPPTELAGRVDMPIPVFDYQAVLDQALREHTDVRTAYNSIAQARFNLRLAKIVPVPDVDLNVLPQKDYTAPPNLIVYSVQASIPVPVWNQNKGGIKQAEALLAQALAGPDQARNALTTTLADAFNRYEYSRQVVRISMRQVRKQIIAFRLVFDRRNLEPQFVAFGDVVNAEQTLALYLQAYVSALGQQWQAAVDVANVLQTDDLFQTGKTDPVEAIPDLRNYLPPCPANTPPAAQKPPQPASEGREQHGT